MVNSLIKRAKEHLYILSEPGRFLIAELKFYKSKKNKENNYKFLNDLEALTSIKENRLSLCRFGDGELKWIMNLDQRSFQVNSTELTKRLSQVISENDERILIGIPNVFGSLSEFNYKSRKFWRLHAHSYIQSWEMLLNSDQVYVNSLLSRRHTNYKDKIVNEKIFSKFKDLWNGRNVFIIEGSKTRLGVGNDLLDSAKTVKRLLAPIKDAFSKYNEIYNRVIEIADIEDLILIALGPTATILAFDLAKKGYQALDIGHLDIEYEWHNRGATTKIPINGKYVNEVIHIQDLSNIELDDKKYQDSIVVSIEK